MSLHLSDDQLVDRLYGVASSQEDTHLDSCEECQTRWSVVQQHRDHAAASAELPAEYFHQQRREIQKRLAAPSPVFGAMWVPAALAIALVAGLFITRTTPKVSAPARSESRAENVEAGWFEDTYSATREMEPRAASPIRELFAEGPVRE
jgi:hypothetical protein